MGITVTPLGAALGAVVEGLELNASNRCTMHYALNDYAPDRRRAVRATIYA